MIVCVPIKVCLALGNRGRVPPDKEFMDVAMRINPQDKMINKEHPREKWVS
jgi:asparagine synthase (glutamine-hydrolysing)